MIERWSRGGCPRAARARSMRTRPLDTRTPCRSTWDGLGDGVLRAAIPRKEVIQPVPFRPATAGQRTSLFSF